MTHLQSNTKSVVDSDLRLIELCERHADLFERCGGDDDDDDALREMCALELTIAATPAHTHVGLDAKNVVVDRADFDREALAVVSEIIRQDLMRVTRSKSH